MTDERRQTEVGAPARDRPGGPRRILVFGGTFDPPHRGHVELPELVRRRIGADEIVYVPAALNPVKAQTPPTAAAHRLAMLGLALRGNPRARISTIELDRRGPSYTVDTLRSLRAAGGAAAELALLIGADQALDFSRWKEGQAVLQLARVVVMLRPPWDRAAFAEAAAERHGEAEAGPWLARVVELPLMDVSATAVRAQLRDGREAPDVPEAVMDYIRAHALYQT